MTEKITTEAPQLAPTDHEIVERRQAALCVVGAGPAGVMLSLFLARKGIPVILLEEHMDFDRDFRGDTIHPMTLAALDQIGLARKMLQTLPHSEIHSASIETADGPFTPINFSYLHTPFPFVALLPQKDFLAFITEKAARYPNFTLLMGARVEELVVEDGVVRGVRYRGQQGWGEVRALVTVGCDGRFSRLRRLGGFSAITTSSPIDVLWFRLPRRPVADRLHHPQRRISGPARAGNRGAAADHRRDRAGDGRSRAPAGELAAGLAALGRLG